MLSASDSGSPTRLVVPSTRVAWKRYLPNEGASLVVIRGALLVRMWSMTVSSRMTQPVRVRMAPTSVLPVDSTMMHPTGMPGSPPEPRGPRDPDESVDSYGALGWRERMSACLL